MVTAPMLLAQLRATTERDAKAAEQRLLRLHR